MENKRCWMIFKTDQFLNATLHNGDQHRDYKFLRTTKTNQRKLDSLDKNHLNGIVPYLQHQSPFSEFFIISYLRGIYLILVANRKKKREYSLSFGNIPPR